MQPFVWITPRTCGICRRTMAKEAIPLLVLATRGRLPQRFGSATRSNLASYLFAQMTKEKCFVYSVMAACNRQVHYLSHPGRENGSCLGIDARLRPSCHSVQYSPHRTAIEYTTM